MAISQTDNWKSSCAFSGKSSRTLVAKSSTIDIWKPSFTFSASSQTDIWKPSYTIMASSQNRVPPPIPTHMTHVFAFNLSCLIFLPSYQACKNLTVNFPHSVSSKFFCFCFYHHLIVNCSLHQQLRYLDALDYGEMDLELPDTPFRVNAWSKTAVDVIAEMDSLQNDPGSFGQFKVGQSLSFS